ncbi:MAG TPA: phosphotransferase [Bacilli bacterium]|nr:phosphotransferase [Bacilli bacterium]
MFDQIIAVANQFCVAGQPVGIQCTDSGNINKTFIVTYQLPDRTKQRYVIQKINTIAFTEPYKVMKNIELVEDLISKQKVERSDLRQSLNIIRTKDGNSMLVITDPTGEKDYYRAYNCIEKAVSFDNTDNLDIVYNTGKAFGNFQSMLADLPIEELEETIPNFHNTKIRYERFMRDVSKDTVDRAASVISEIEFVKSRKELSTILTSAIEEQRIPLRVCHNDTKISNVMMRQDKGQWNFETVIDWDTIMPGCSGYDFGDGVRSATATTTEDDTDLTKVSFDTAVLKAYAKGYLEEMAPFMDEPEVTLLGQSIKVITYELGIRFLNDYINGDTYFNIKYPNHNLDRARNQFKLLTEFEKAFPEINDYIMATYKELRPTGQRLVKEYYE